VGKTELAKALAEFLFNNENNMVRIDMSEYQERHTVSRLIGAPPGYVGYEESGQLSEAVRRRPYSVILLDEIEKAHQDIFNILLQVLDDGRLTDNKGRTVNFKNTIIIMTSNLGSHIIQERFEKMTDQNKEDVLQQTREDVFNLLKMTIRPEFLNRIDDIIMFKPLSKEEIKEVVRLQFRQLQSLLSKNNMLIEITGNAVEWIADMGYDPQYGARPVKRIMQRNILNELSKMILNGSVNQDHPILVDTHENKLVFRN
jgi:ATP-dependent Clp protease ATP-binding subunit ClpB